MLVVSFSLGMVRHPKTVDGRFAAVETKESVEKMDINMPMETQKTP
jgi:hypothetical protein